MGNVLASLLPTSQSMRAYEKGLNVAQSNVTNASTPGYVKQTQVFQAETFDLSQGLPGGVKPGEMLSSRNEYAESAVRKQQQALGQADQRSSDLAQIEPVFSLADGAGVSGGLSRFFQSFNSLSITPNSSPSRQAVIDSAKELASTFNQTAASLQQASATADHDLKSNVDSVNKLVTTLQQLNSQVRQNADIRKDPGFDAQVHNTLEQLSELVDYTALAQADGTTTILIGGQTSALVGEHSYPLSVDLSGNSAILRDSAGKDITSQIQGGRIQALLTSRNTSIPSYLGDLNQLSSTFADRVNSVLASGVDATGAAPVVNLFNYNGAIGAAQTLTVNALAPSDVAAALPTAVGGNGNALVLAGLGNSKEVNGFTFTEFYGTIGGRVGRDLASAKQDVQTTSSLLTQAKGFRADNSAVSLDEEAAKVIEFQRSYQASAKLFTVLKELTDTIMGMLP